jgi:LmbE family N-acetylglucosaminyl deacetylase
VLELAFKKFEQAATVLLIGAHCDDIEIGCGATLRRLVREFPKLNFKWVVFTSEQDRRAETVAAAARFIGNKARYELSFLDFKGSYFPAYYAPIKDALESIKSQVNPDLIFTHSLHDRHQDHKLLAELTWNTYRSHLIFEYEIPKFEGDLGHPNLFVPVSETDLADKIDILLSCFPTQSHRSWFTPDTFRGLARIRGIECAAQSGFAEAFTARKVTI